MVMFFRRWPFLSSHFCRGSGSYHLFSPSQYIAWCLGTSSSVQLREFKSRYHHLLRVMLSKDLKDSVPHFIICEIGIIILISYNSCGK